MITYVTGDLFTTPGIDALAHGVNCAGVMGIGIAVEFRRRWPEMFAAYRAQCLARNLRPGDVLAWGKSPIIYNLATQQRPGRRATLRAIRVAIGQMLFVADGHRVTRIGLPRIGCGYGGLLWADVRAALEDVAGLARVELIVVTPPQDA